MAAWLQHKEASHKDDAHSVILFRKKLTSKQKLTCDVTVSVTASGAGGTLSGAGNASSASGDKLPKCIQSVRMPQANLCKYYTDIWMTHEKKKRNIKQAIIKGREGTRKAKWSKWRLDRVGE